MLLSLAGASAASYIRPVLPQVFDQGAPFDYGVTLSDAVDMPINMGMQFVQRGRFPHAISFLQDVMAIYPFNETFTAGQVKDVPCRSHRHEVKESVLFQCNFITAFFIRDELVPLRLPTVFLSVLETLVMQYRRALGMQR